MKQFLIALTLMSLVVQLNAAGLSRQLSRKEAQSFITKFLKGDDEFVTNQVLRHDCDDSPTCAETSMKKFGYIIPDCMKVGNDTQEACASKSIDKFNYIIPDCFKLVAGGLCAEISLDKFNYIIPDCFKIANRRQDRCAKQSIELHNYVIPDCFRL